MIAAHLEYRFRAVSGFHIHSPFVYEFYTEIIRDRTLHPEYAIVEKQRAKLLRMRSLLETTDFGAGANDKIYKTRYRQVREIAKHSSVSRKLGRLLFRMVRHAHPQEVLELGTALGVSTMYMALAAPGSRITGMEGCSSIAEVAHQNFSDLNIDNVKLLIGNFDALLPAMLENIGKIDFVLIDGNHREKPTIGYFKQILPRLHPDSIVVIDDIHWSKGMHAAWKQIKDMPGVSISIEIFNTGILLFRENIARQDFVLKF